MAEGPDVEPELSVVLFVFLATHDCSLHPLIVTPCWSRNPRTSVFKIL